MKLPDGHHAVKSGTKVEYVTRTGRESILYEGERAIKLWASLTAKAEDDETAKETAAEVLKSGTQNGTYATEATERENYMSSYQAATLDHPFLDMSTGAKARRADAQIMKDYLGTDDPPDPYLELDYCGNEIALPNPLDIGTDELFNKSEYRLALILGSGLSKLRAQPAYEDETTGYRQQFLIGKAVPSGGSRHPTEAFVEIRCSPYIRPGVYHFSTKYNALCPLVLGREKRRSSERRATPWSVTVHLCSYVPRAMYRYRDPRSARAIFVDAGHVDAQLQSFAEYCNWRYKSAVAVETEFGEQFGLESNCPRLIKCELEGE